MIGSGEVVVILCVILLLFGGKKLPEFAKSLGKGIREFKKACSGIEEDIEVSGPESRRESLPSPRQTHLKSIESDVNQE